MSFIDFLSTRRWPTFQNINIMYNHHKCFTKFSSIKIITHFKIGHSLRTFLWCFTLINLPLHLPQVCSNLSTSNIRQKKCHFWQPPGDSRPVVDTANYFLCWFHYSVKMMMMMMHLWSYWVYLEFKSLKNNRKGWLSCSLWTLISPSLSLHTTGVNVWDVVLTWRTRTLSRSLVSTYSHSGIPDLR